MHWQTVLTALIVSGSAAYAVWTLMPAALRARCLLAMGRAPVAASGCAGGCSGCSTGAKAAPAPGNPQVIRLVRRRPSA